MYKNGIFKKKQNNNEFAEVKKGRLPLWKCQEFGISSSSVNSFVERLWEAGEMSVNIKILNGHDLQALRRNSTANRHMLLLHLQIQVSK